jgi:plasmid stabilization system protein ParE
MASSFQLTLRAIEDLEEIWCYIAEGSVQAADRVEAAILIACNRLSRFLKLGSKRSEITPLPVRFWTVTRFPNSLVVYRPETKPLQVIAILHAKRDLWTLLREMSPLESF